MGEHMLALVDGDIVLHRCGYASDNDPEDIAIVRTDIMMKEILHETGSDHFEVWLSDNRENNYRYQVDPQYKANRKQPRPVHYDAIKEFLFSEWKANLALGQEADDSLGIRQIEENRNPIGENLAWITLNSIICSIDKDLLQIPGKHYNFVRKEFTEISPIEGLRHFYKQLLIGDTSDNVRGVEKIGPVKAGKLLNGVSDPLDMFDIVRECYQDDVRLLRNGKLLHIRQKEDEEWEFPKVISV